MVYLLCFSPYFWVNINKPPCLLYSCTSIFCKFTNCGRQKELAILISTLLSQTHALQLCSLALTGFLLNSFEMRLEEYMECKERYFSRAARVIWILYHVKLTHNSRADQCQIGRDNGIGIDVSVIVALHQPV